jgi:solute carrier family 25 (adenine nucleotide translocator) protein 4/5/6/31
MSAKKHPQSNRENAISFIKDLSAGGVSGIVAKTITAPVERVKLLMQTQGSNRDLQIRYKGPIDCLTRVYKEQGFFAFWRGNVAGVMRYFPAHSITFAFKDRYKIFFTGLYSKPDFYQVHTNIHLYICIENYVYAYKFV